MCLTLGHPLPKLILPTRSDGHAVKGFKEVYSEMDAFLTGLVNTRALPSGPNAFASAVDAELRVREVCAHMHTRTRTRPCSSSHAQ